MYQQYLINLLGKSVQHKLSAPMTAWVFTSAILDTLLFGVGLQLLLTGLHFVPCPSCLAKVQWIHRWLSSTKIPLCINCDSEDLWFLLFSATSPKCTLLNISLHSFNCLSIRHVIFLLACNFLPPVIPFKIIEALWLSKLKLRWNIWGQEIGNPGSCHLWEKTIVWRWHSS